MWEEAGDANYERAALHATRYADIVRRRGDGVFATRGKDAALILTQAQVYATLALAQATNGKDR